jgi:hypothetical protein
VQLAVEQHAVQKIVGYIITAFARWHNSWAENVAEKLRKAIPAAVVSHENIAALPTELTDTLPAASKTNTR